MIKEITVGVTIFAAGSLITWMATQSEEKLIETQMSALSSKIIKDKNFRKIILSDFKADGSFKGKDGLDGKDFSQISLKDYKISTSDNQTKNLFTTNHSFCAVSGLEFNFGGTGGNKICVTKVRENGTWIVEARAEHKQNLVCTVSCF
ncbi:hypothetical protein GMES_1201 [Paraglaciecola mesophila KMM 241]|uniref:Uncharacterized protein n=1 Tax=Paraglaciecola mesophila KMM 241 TaxID=1128912 RepID=K6ZJE2_9ALTE|nr:hypothetical protein [Paraglaciecola mesophila]GAC23500.1 hypothetical protein GMES_1201 [Paraglaciecola mesophila KMM 241]